MQAKYISKISSRSNEHGDVIWLKLDKSFFGLDHHIILCYLYIVPDAKKECFELLRSELDKYQSKGITCILGDVNSRFGTRIIEHTLVDATGEHPDIHSLYVPSRNNKDKTINANGRKLHKIANDYDFIPANGTVIGDYAGEYTCISWNGLSANDLFLVQRDMFSRVQYFKVDGSWDWYSDHKSISLSIRVQISNKSNKKDPSWKHFTKNKLKWDTESINKFKSVLNNPEIINKFNHFSNTHFITANKAAESFTDIIGEVIKLAFPKSSDKRTNITRKNRRPRFFSPPKNLNALLPFFTFRLYTQFPVLSFCLFRSENLKKFDTAAFGALHTLQLSGIGAHKILMLVGWLLSPHTRVYVCTYVKRSTIK